ncbi:major facilitator superfamily domain-containing protein [Dichotomocladium elegans]|nr:major facilitator superfamily domain-containing protein [Dichotomocladium elegans]
MSSSTSPLRRAIQSRLQIRPLVERDPRLLPSHTKAFILLILSLCGGCAGFSSTIYFPGIPNITADLHAPSIATTLTAALFILMMGIAPVFLGAVSDYYEIRRSLFLVTMLVFAISSLGNAFINNIWGMVVLRCVQAVGASCGQSIGAGVIADCYPIEKRGSAFGKYFLGMFLGPLLGPIIGGFLIMSPLSWRATYWFCFAYGVFVALLLFVFYPETYRGTHFDRQLPTITVDEKPAAAEHTSPDDPAGADRSRCASSEASTVSISMDPAPTNKNDNQLVESTVKKTLNPILPFLLLRHPHILLAAVVSGVAFGAMFAVETIIPNLYESHYGFNSWKTGLSFLGAGVGNFLGAVTNSYLSDRLLLRAREKRGGRHKAEDRLTVNVWPSGLIFIPFGVLLFGWGTESDMTVWTGIVGFGIMNFGMNQVMTATSTYIIDATTPGISATATGVANFVRMLFACVLSLCANPMVDAIGAGYTAVFLAALAVLSMGLLLILKLYGQTMRRKSGFEQAGEREQHH